MSIDRPCIAAVFYAPGQPVDDLFAAAVERLRAEGLLVRGALQADTRDADGCCGPMRLKSLSDGGETVISQNLGRLASGCRLDPQALAAAAVTLGTDLADGADLLMLNRFGKAEADGGGLRSVMEQAVEAGIPVILAVRNDYRAAWADFHGGLADTVQADTQAIAAWCRAAVAPRKAA